MTEVDSTAAHPLQDFIDEVKRAHRFRWEANPTGPYIEMTPEETEVAVYRLIATMEEAQVSNYYDECERQDVEENFEANFAAIFGAEKSR